MDGSQGGQRQGPGEPAAGQAGSHEHPPGPRRPSGRFAEPCLAPQTRACILVPSRPHPRASGLETGAQGWGGGRHRGPHFFMSRAFCPRQGDSIGPRLSSDREQSSLGGEPLQSRCHPVVKAPQLGVTKAALILGFGLGNVGVRAQSSREL